MEQRSYNQYCATARTLDIVGERWTLLLIRELLTGPKRFSDLQRSLRGLGTGLLSTRLKYLEQQRLAQKITLPPPARAPAYELTEAGAELAPAVLSLARWGMKWAMADPRDDEVFHPGWAVLALRACFDSDAASGLRVVYEFRVGDEVFHARIDDGTIDTVHGPVRHPDLTITTDDRTFREIAAGRTTLAAAVRNATAVATGDRAALRALRTVFRLPTPVQRIAAAPNTQGS
ncbi:winged helix-turn-helix transcriptional regulator [Nocardia sp. NBC_01009]|uniref:winged helix-turn-helix transcriptional regulator n=1 Tax=Nocardia sp. NBC_01009 TaxID=2975996 RepID=UPI00386742DE|nr:winged helix-turn-helix transcriptional regulator [Nocardia sp. NBC_01009]